MFDAEAGTMTVYMVDHPRLPRKVQKVYHIRIVKGTIHHGQGYEHISFPTEEQAHLPIVWNP